MAPETWDQATRHATQLRSGLARVVSGARHWASVGSDRVTSMRQARVEVWRLVFSAATVIVASSLLSLVRLPNGFAVITIFLMVIVALSTYVADWVGGVTSTLTGVVMLDMVMIGEHWRFDLWHQPRQLWGVAAFMVAAGCLIALFEHLKYDRAAAKLEATAMRAANTAFNAVEIAAASRPAGDSEAFVHVLESILTAMVRVNRASAGALYLVDAPNKTLIQAAAYGETGDDYLSDPEYVRDPSGFRVIPIDEGFVGQVARERRPITIPDISDSNRAPDVLATNLHVRSVVGVPIFGPTDALAGVAWVGLYAPWRFSQTSIARLQALAHRTVAFMESARLADQQEELLDRVQSNHRRLQSVIQTMPEAVMVARPPHGVILTYNAAAQRMFGLPKEQNQLLTRRISQLWVGDSHGEKTDDMPMQRTMRDGSTITGVELTVRTPGGTPLPVVGSAAPLLTDDGEIDAIVGVFQDVSPLKEAERLRDEFISVVSHELRSPLTPIRGFSQIIARDLEKEGHHEQHVAWLTTLQLHTDRLTRLVDDLLDVSRMRAGRLRVLREDVDVIQICQAVVESRRASQSTHRLVLETELTTLPAVLDGDRIHQVIDNLVGNAIKYTNGGTISVAVSHLENDDIEIRVADEGRGIPPDERESLFTAFYRARSANESAVPGLGLGLYIVRELIRAHDGDIMVTESPAGGAMFVITIPRRPE